MRLKPFLSALSLLAALSPSAHATLGEQRSTIRQDMLALKATKHSTIEKENYTIERLTLPIGTVDEYVSSQGIVFAVAWQGSSHPDLTSIFGNYMQEYNEGRARHRAKSRHRHERFKVNSVEYERGGHMRKVGGRAFSEPHAPQGVTINDIKYQAK